VASGLVALLAGQREVADATLNGALRVVTAGLADNGAIVVTDLQVPDLLFWAPA
jgi:hypothetical protein